MTNIICFSICYYRKYFSEQYTMKTYTNADTENKNKLSFLKEVVTKKTTHIEKCIVAYSEILDWTFHSTKKGKPLNDHHKICSG